MTTSHISGKTRRMDRARHRSCMYGINSSKGTLISLALSLLRVYPLSNRKHFPDTIDVVPEVMEQFFPGDLYTIKKINIEKLT